jgi:hypothetical protein
MSAPSGSALPLAADSTALAPAIRVPVTAEAEYVALDPHDSRLDQACDDLAYLVAHGGAPTTDIATAVLRMHGIVDPPNKVLAGAVGEALDAKFGQDLYRPNAMVGKGSFEQTAVEILIFLPRIRIGPVPRATDTSVELAVVLDAQLRDPHVTVADAYASHQLHVELVEHILRFTVACGARPSEQFVTIEAVDPRLETKPLVIFPIYCKLKPPATLAAEPAKNLSGYTDLDGRLTAILDRERAAAGIPPLRRDARVERAALAYAESRAANRNADRQTVMRDAGLIAPSMSWSTFHVDSLEGAVDRVLNSSEELSKLRNPERTDIGVGARRDAEGWWISIVYVTIPPVIDTAEAASRIAHAIQLFQQSRSLQTKIDAYASVVATHYANALAFGWRSEDLEESATVEMQMNTGEGPEYATDSRVELASLDIVKLVNKHAFHAIGVGVSQSARSGPLAGTIWIVVIFY